MPNLPSIPSYHVGHVLSRSGGTAIVYWGVDLKTGYPVAIKQLYASRRHCLDLRDEAQKYLYLRHPNLTRLVDFVIDGDQCYLIMEFVEGKPLDEYQKTQSGPLPDEVAIPIFMQLLDTIKYLHDNNVLHLDIKPNNIMIKDDRSIKVLDMGISTRLHGSGEHSKVRGTPSFMPPEQIDGARLGRYTDIFALGVTLYYMLTMHLPFPGTTTQEIWDNIKRGNHTPMEAYYPFVNKKLAPVIAKALHPDPRQRYRDCREMIRDLRRVSPDKF